jgi:hypothetical protein
MSHPCGGHHQDDNMLTHTFSCSTTGTNVFPPSDKPYYRTGLWVCAAACLAIVALSISLSLWIIRENKQLDREEAQAAEGNDKDSVEGQVQQRQHRCVW